ncbi:related to Pre-mRNA-splicing factor SPP2 [Melanopsichium pennsylvanicum]|uniref:Related to Pre-mRNA-splicing factor SPP2 n=1 Tax=Melanopsichium pennsylvanicum TaxID=63383 RepID=A0AAJ5C864_9BASI|nr:related to Pre-mRNA-splicing factor SPP2 [Melanopsichium pennsylvanicum]
MVNIFKGDLAKSSSRPRAFDISDDEDDANRLTGRHEQIVSFGRDGAHGSTRSPPTLAPRVIPVTSNLDWRKDRKQRLGMASNLQALGPLVSMRRAGSSAVPESNASFSTDKELNTDAINTEAHKSGLEFRRAKTRNIEPIGDSSLNAVPAQDPSSAASAASAPPGTDIDTEALRALLTGEGAGNHHMGQPLVIPQELESEMLQHDIGSRPEAPTLDDYAATPIDQFGMALLRGMGWNEGTGAGKGGKGPQQAAEPKKRAALLGLGAKERPAGSSGLASLSASRGHRPKDKRDYKYVPVAKGGSQNTSNGQSETFEPCSRGDRPRDTCSSRNERKHTDDRHSSSRQGSLRHELSHSSHRPRSRSPRASRHDDRERQRDRRRDKRDSEGLSHGSSRSAYDRRSDRDRSDRDPPARSRDDRRRDRRR